MKTDKAALEQEVAKTNNQTGMSTEDGVIRIGITRIGHAYIAEHEGNLPANYDLEFTFDQAGNQTRREVVQTN